MTVTQAVKQRQSCRHYDGAPVPRETISELTELAGLSPSACNSQPWGVVAVDREEDLQDIRRLVQSEGSKINRFAARVPVFLVLYEMETALREDIAARFVDEQCFAPVDIGIFAANLTLLAAERGLGTCILGWFDEAAVRARFPLPGAARVRLVIALGHPSGEEKQRVKTRKPVQDVLHFL